MARYVVLRIATVKTTGHVVGSACTSSASGRRAPPATGEGLGWEQRPTVVLAASPACVTETTRATAVVVHHEIIAVVREVRMVCLDAV